MKDGTPPVPIAVLASGRGSNFEAIERECRTGLLNARIVCVLSDKTGAGVLEKAAALGIPSVVVTPDPTLPPMERRTRHEKAILAALHPFSPKFLVLAGYMRVLTTKLIEAFRAPQGHSRIVNVHPSLLPSFPGVAAYRQAFYHGVKVTGATVHLVEEVVDGGPICAQEAFSIAGCKHPEDVERLGLEVEHRLYPRTLSWVLAERFEIFDRRVLVQ